MCFGICVSMKKILIGSKAPCGWAFWLYVPVVMGLWTLGNNCRIRLHRHFLKLIDECSQLCYRQGLKRKNLRRTFLFSSAFDSHLAPFCVLRQELGHTFRTKVSEGRRIKKAVWGVNRFPSYFIIMIGLSLCSVFFRHSLSNETGYHPYLTSPPCTHAHSLRFFTFGVRFYFRRICDKIPAHLNKIAQLYVSTAALRLFGTEFGVLFWMMRVTSNLTFFWSDRSGVNFRKHFSIHQRAWCDKCEMSTG